MCRVQQLLTRFLVVSLLIQVSAVHAWSASYKILHSFSGQPAGNPSSGLVADKAGNGYGTTAAGGPNKAGTVYQLSPKTGFSVIYTFSGPDGRTPQGNLAIDDAGNLYGTTVNGGDLSACNNLGCGTVFRLSPPTNGSIWSETVLYSFQGGTNDGANPKGGVSFDSSGNLFGTTTVGGNQSCQAEGPGCGTVFELRPSGSDWTEKVIHAFNGNDGGLPQSTPVFDTAGNLYAVAGFVFQMSPDGGDGWNFSVLYFFDPRKGDPTAAQSSIVLDVDGNVYGTSPLGGSQNKGTVFELLLQNGQWTEKILHDFAGGSDGAQPEAGLAIDADGNLYGTTYAGGSLGFSCSGNGCGTAFELMPGQGGQWTERRFAFPKSGSLGIQPAASLLLDQKGNAYGTTTLDGPLGEGVVFRITP